MRRFADILVVADEASWSDAVGERARWLARTNGARITLVDVVEDDRGQRGRLLAALAGDRADALAADIAGVRADRLEEIAEGIRADGRQVATAVLSGTAFIEIIRRVLREGHDLVLKGAHRGSDRPLLRAPDLHLLRKCPCPVWILNGAVDARSRHIVAAVDPDPLDPVRDGLCHRVLELATSLAAADEARLDVLNAWHLLEETMLRHARVHVPEDEIQAILANEERDSAARLDALLADFAGFSDRIRRLHLKGAAAEIIPEHVASEGIDTLIMGTLGRTGIAGFFIGNTAETVLNRVDCSVLAVKPEGFVSPVTAEAGA